PSSRKVSHMGLIRSMRMSRARFLLFNFWLVMFLLYVLCFLVLGALEPKIGFEQGSNAAWKMAYIQLPILSAFASFWFVPNLGQQRLARDNPTLDTHRVYAMFALTGIVHVVLVVYFVMGVVLVKWDYPDRGEAFADRVDTGARLMVWLFSLAIVPVGYA